MTLSELRPGLHAGPGFDEDAGDIGPPLSDDGFHPVDGRLHLAAGKPIPEAQLEVEEDVVRSQMHGEDPSHLLHRRIGHCECHDVIHDIGASALPTSRPLLSMASRAATPAKIRPIATDAAPSK